MIFLVFIDDRKMRIEVGYGLEPTLTDAVASSIIRDVVAPRFREGKIADGIGAGLDAIEAAIKGTYRAPAPRAAPTPAPLNYAQILLLLVVLGGIGVAVIPTLFFDRGTRRERLDRPRHPAGAARTWAAAGSGAAVLEAAAERRRVQRRRRELRRRRRQRELVIERGPLASAAR